MHPVLDVDALLVLAVALSSKRRPASLAEIVAAIDLIQAAIPAEAKLAEAFARLARHGLISEHALDEATGFSLNPAAEAMVAELPKKAETAERLFAIKGKLGAWNTETPADSIEVSVTQLAAAIAMHRKAGTDAGKNLLMPKPKSAETEKARPGLRQRRPPPPRRRKG